MRACFRYAGIVTCTGFEKSGGKVTEVHAEFNPLKEGDKPPKVGTPSQNLPNSDHSPALQSRGHGLQVGATDWHPLPGGAMLMCCGWGWAGCAELGGAASGRPGAHHV